MLNYIFAIFFLAKQIFFQSFFKDLISKNIFDCYEINLKSHISYFFIAYPKLLKKFAIIMNKEY